MGIACTHYWVIGSPEGETSWGVCRLCGARKEFKNSLGDKRNKYNRYPKPVTVLEGTLPHRESVED